MLPQGTTVFRYRQRERFRMRKKEVMCNQCSIESQGYEWILIFRMENSKVYLSQRKCSDKIQEKRLKIQRDNLLLLHYILRHSRKIQNLYKLEFRVCEPTHCFAYCNVHEFPLELRTENISRNVIYSYYITCFSLICLYKD